MSDGARTIKIIIKGHCDILALGNKIHKAQRAEVEVVGKVYDG
jgi:hypothetical protein